MVKITKEAALAYHESVRPGKIEVKPTKPYRTQTDIPLVLHSHAWRFRKILMMYTSILTKETLWLSFPMALPY